MKGAVGLEAMAVDRDQRISDVVGRERSRLLGFIRRRVSDPLDAEDVLQDVFSELVEANRLLMPIDHVTAWLFRVARNRIIDLLRRKRPELEGRSFKDMAAETGVSVDTLLSRKRYAVRHLRRRLRSVHDEFTRG